MDDLILKKLAGRATELELRRLEQWRRSSDANERAYRTQEEAWVLGEVLRPETALTPPPAAEIMAEAERRRTRAGVRRRRGRILRSPWVGYALAAAAVAGLLFMGLGRIGGEAGQPLQAMSSSTMAGDVVTMALSDGSVVRLASASSLRFPPAADTREVVLQGRAFFAVAHGEKAFVVRTTAGRITVHGTRFEVRSEGDETRLVVVEGQVRLEGDGGGVDVGAGEVAFLRSGEPPRVVEHADVWSMLDWPAGLLLFQGTPLGEVAREIGRTFHKDVQVSDAVAGRRVTAWFEDEPLDDVVSAVCLVTEIRCVVGDSTVTMEAR